MDRPFKNDAVKFLHKIVPMLIPIPNYSTTPVLLSSSFILLNPNPLRPKIIALTTYSSFISGGTTRQVCFHRSWYVSCVSSEDFCQDEGKNKCADYVKLKYLLQHDMPFIPDVIWNRLQLVVDHFNVTIDQWGNFHAFPTRVVVISNYSFVLKKCSYY